MPKTSSVTCTAVHPVDLDDGRTLAPGEVGLANLEAPHNAALISSGALTKNSDSGQKGETI